MQPEATTSCADINSLDSRVSLSQGLDTASGSKHMSPPSIPNSVAAEQEDVLLVWFELHFVNFRLARPRNFYGAGRLDADVDLSFQHAALCMPEQIPEATGHVKAWRQCRQATTNPLDARTLAKKHGFQAWPG